MMKTDDLKNRETIPYRCWKQYHDNFFTRSNVGAVLKEARDFVAGRQYINQDMDGQPKPIFNIVREYVVKTSAKLLERPFHVSFIADTENQNLKKLEDFYDCQRKKMKDDDMLAQAVHQAIIDGVVMSITSYDEDTLGTESLYRGFIKRQHVLFENFFFENPYRNDVQDQQYLGYYFPMDIKTIKSLYEGDELTKEQLDELIIPDNVNNLNEFEGDKLRENIDNAVANVYVRFFRIEGEVFFEMSTRYVDLFMFPHSINPRTNNTNMKKRKKELLEAIKKDKVDNDKKVIDYATDGAKYLLFTKPTKTTSKEHKKEKGKFYLYPVSMYRPYPIINSVLGESMVSLMVANQKIINYVFLLVILIMQNHAMPKILTKPDALKSQEIDNSPSQVLVDYTPISSGVSWGITRLGSGDAVNSNLIEIGQTLIALTRNIYGFDDLVQSAGKNQSGFMYQQLIEQANLSLQQPQNRLWGFIRDNATIDLMYFKHYVDKAKYYTPVDISSYQLNENYKQMSQDLITAGQVDGVPRETILPETRRVQSHDIGEELFDNDFDVIIDVEQGIASSQLSESQHFKEVFQYIATGNTSADMLKIMIQNDPAFSMKLRQKLMAGIEALEVSQLAIKEQEIAKLQEVIMTLQANLKASGRNLDILVARDKARERAMKEQAGLNKATLEAFASSQPLMSESEVKAQNAKGISGGRFDPTPE